MDVTSPVVYEWTYSLSILNTVFVKTIELWSNLIHSKRVTTFVASSLNEFKILKKEGLCHGHAYTIYNTQNSYFQVTSRFDSII